MIHSQFTIGLMGEPDYSDDGKTRLRYIVAEALSFRALHWQIKGRPDKAARLRWVISRISTGQRPTKRVLDKCARDIEAIQAELTQPAGSSRVAGDSEGP